MFIFFRILVRCVLTVLTLSESSPATCETVLPEASSFRISNSRSERRSCAAPSASPASREASVSASSGLTQRPPPAILRMASVSLSGALFPDLPDQLDAAAARQIDVEHDDVEALLAHGLQDGLRRSRLAADVNVTRLTQDLTQAPPHDRMVVADQDLDHCPSAVSNGT